MLGAYTNPIAHDFAEAEAEREARQSAIVKAARGPDYVAEPVDLSHIPPMLAAASAEREKAELEQIRQWVFSDLENYKAAFYARKRFNEPATLVALNELIEAHEKLLASVESMLKGVKP